MSCSQNEESLLARGEVCVASRVVAINFDPDQVNSKWRLLPPNSCSVTSVKWGGGCHPGPGQLSPSQRASPQLELIDFLARCLHRQLIHSLFFLIFFFLLPSTILISLFLFMFLPTLPSPLPHFPFPFLPLPTSRWPEKKNSLCNWGEECTNTSEAPCQLLLGGGQDCEWNECSHLPQRLSPYLSPELLCPRCVRVYSEIVYFIHWAFSFHH